MRHPRPVLSAAAIVLSLALAIPCPAAPDAGSKARGDYNFYGHSAHHAFTSARSHVDTYQRYLADAHGVAVPTRSDSPIVASPAVSAAAAAPAKQVVSPAQVDAEIARESGDAIADDIERIQRHVSRMRERAMTLDDKAALGELDDVEKRLGDARRAHAALHEHHAGESISPDKAMELAHKVNEALRAAHAEHDDVMRRIETSAAGK